MKIKVLLNPYSNSWNSQRRWVEADSVLRTTAHNLDLSVSEHVTHLIDLTVDAVKDCTRLKIHFDELSLVHMDGESFDHWRADLKYKFFPTTVKKLVP